MVLRLGAIVAAGALAVSLLVACGAGATPTSVQHSEGISPVDRSQVIILGDVDPDEPIKKLKRFQPLADYLAKNLGEFGIVKGQVVVARNIEEMGRFLKDMEVDVYFDSAFPALAVQELSGSRFILRRSKEGVSTYWSTYVTLKNTDIGSAEDFLGKIIAFEEPRSTSGFVLPAGTLVLSQPNCWQDRDGEA